MFSLGYMTHLLPTIFLLAVAAIVPPQDKKAVPGMPFGPITAAEFDHLQAFAQATGFDLQGELARVYGGDKKISADALGRVFAFSLSFKAFNQDARAYGTLISISLDRIGEPYGVDYYVKILERQPASVQQRIRDFLFYPSSLLPAQERDEAQSMLHKAYPTLFPDGFKFADKDTLFVLRDYLPDFSLTIVQAGRTKDLTVSLVNISKDSQEFVDLFSDPYRNSPFGASSASEIRMARFRLYQTSSRLTRARNITLIRRHLCPPCLPEEAERRSFYEEVSSRAWHTRSLWLQRVCIMIRSAFFSPFR